MSDPIKAVFLSYASQDAEAAKRIAEALRAAGIEVWFDVEGGLETGDEWDAKIRRQIKECVLFIPLISANTQAREEGYFRIEWDLAAERARGIASGVAFILPIVIDDTREPDALVPDRFRSVQWTRASGGELPPATLAKLAKLWSHRTGLAKHRADSAAGAARPESVPAASATPSAGPNRSRGVWLGAAGLAVALVLGAGFYFRQSAGDPPSLEPPPSATNPAPVAADYPRDPDVKRARALLFTTDAIPDDFVLAEDIIKPLVAQRPNDPEVAVVAAEVALEFLIRGFDLAPARRTQVQRLTERAAQLAPRNPYAVAAVGRYLLFIDAQLNRAEELTRRAIALKPDEARFHRTLFTILSRTKPAAEADAFGERMAALFPDDALVAYDIARRYKDENNLEQMEKWFDRTLTHESPPAFAFVWKAWIMLQIHGDFAATKSWLDRVPDRQRANARVANARYVQALYSGDTGHALLALNEVADEWLTDFDFTGPKALLVGNLHLRNGRADLAQVQLEAALALANSEIEKNPTDLFPRRAKMWVLISLGRLEEARAIYPLLLQATRRPYVLNFRNLSWTNTVTSSLLLGYRDDALTLLREAVSGADAGTRLVLRNLFQLDPRLAPWRDDAEIKAIFAEPAGTASGASNKIAPVPASEGAQLAARAKELYTKFAYTREDLATAEALARHAAELEPGSAVAWGALAAVHGTYLQRGWDLSDKRRAAAQDAARKALGLDPEQTEALFGLGYVLARSGSREQSFDLFRRAYASDPTDTRLARTYAGALAGVGREEESTAILEQARRRDPTDPLVHYSLALNLIGYVRRPGDTPERIARGIAHLDDGIAVQPLATLVLARAVMAIGLQGDLALARSLLARLEQRPLEERSEDRAIHIPLWIATLERDPARAQAVAAFTARDFFEDWVALRRPKAWHLALVRFATGKEALARLDWQQAETLIRERLRAEPGSVQLQWELACTLAWLGRGEEADAIFAPLEAAWREELTASRAVLLAHYAAARADGAKTAQYLRRGLGENLMVTHHTVPLDPWFDKVRHHPDVQRVLAEAAAQP